LSVEIGDFNVIIIGTGQFTLDAAAETGQSELLDEFTAQSTSTNQEKPKINLENTFSNNPTFYS